jgi:hypothetical protein
MKKNKIIYWVSTGIITVMMLYIAFGYFTNTEMKASFIHLGFPDYFRVELGVFKVFGALALIIPIVPNKIKEYAYFGFGLTFISAFIAHVASGDPTPMAIMPIVFLAILVVSYIFHNRNY